MAQEDKTKVELTEEISLLQKRIAELEILDGKRKQTEEQIRHAAEEWRVTFDSITDLISIMDEDFRLIRVNKAFANIFKLEPKEAIGKFCYELVHGAKGPHPDCPYKEAHLTGKATMAEFFDTYLNKYLEVSVSPIFDDKGDSSGAVHFVRDISERKNLEEEAHKRLRELEIFYMAGVGREVRILELKNEIASLKEQLMKNSGK